MQEKMDFIKRSWDCVEKICQQRQKEKIDAMKLPGITFTKTVKRNYPQGTFASHLIGFGKL